MSKKAQLILYNQCHTEYLTQADEYLFIISSQKPQSPVGALDLNIYSRLLEYAITRHCKENIKNDWKKVRFLTGESYEKLLTNYCREEQISQLYIMKPSENYLYSYFLAIEKKLSKQWVLVVRWENTQFLVAHDLFREKFDKPPIMETFYRWMRKETWVLITQEGKPVGWKRNFDKQNRWFDKNFADHQPLFFKKTQGRKEAEKFYQKEKKQLYPVTREQAYQQLRYFCENTLDRFGELQDAMYSQSNFVHHSLLSVAINFWLLTTQEVITTIEETDTPINNKEGCIRQILWRREYMYHYFQFYKDTIYTENVLWHIERLPSFFWWPEKSPLKMHCINNALQKVKKHAYGHHIERLMLIGNFLLLCKIQPSDVLKWFWEMYADAFERVVTPNVLWMSQFADGSKLATKPYISSANYINKMSNYCKSCFYDPKLKEWEKACPFNYLYRDFIAEKKERYKSWRQPYILKHLEKKNLKKIADQSDRFRKEYMEQ